MITLQVARPWHVKTPILYRYLDQQYIDEFFETGRLRLSTFATFAEHEDEQRHDPNEGTNILIGTAEDQTVFAVTKHGHRELILSTSTRADEQLMEAFDTNGYFRIKDSTNFGAAVAMAIPGFAKGLEGFCVYQDRRTIERQIERIDLDDLKEDPADENPSLNKLAAEVFKLGGPNVFFVKLSRYSNQNEYRLIWSLTRDVNEALFVDCPEARQFCEKVT